MEFKEFVRLQQKHIKKMLEESTLFETDTDKDCLWNLYLDSFPEGTNKVYRNRREFDCSVCRSFVKRFGSVVTIKNNELITVWDFDVPKDSIYYPVIKAMSELVKSKKIKDVFLSKESKIGQEKSFEKENEIIQWNHFYVNLPDKFVVRYDLPAKIAIPRDNKTVFEGSLQKISLDAVQTVLELVAQKSLYKGEEWNAVLNQFKKILIEYSKIEEEKRDTYCWIKSIEVGPVISKIKNHSIGVLLQDITECMDLEDAVKRYEKIVAPTNYKRPQAIFTKKMLEDAKKTITDMGYLDSLQRRFAQVEDITINNILFANKDTMKIIDGDVFSELEKETKQTPKSFSKVEEVNIDTFINDILPTAKTIEVLVENKHRNNLVSLIAPKIPNSNIMFKWNNNFSWAYNGNVTDSIKENVSKAGGKVDGVLRFSIQWNENCDNENDYDAHCKEATGNHIYFGNPKRPSTSGMLDVDIRIPNHKVAVENITWTNKEKMKEGVYEFWVNNFSDRGGKNGFRAEIEYDGQIWYYDYSNHFGTGKNVQVATINFSKTNGITFINSLESTQSNQTIWNLTTNNFTPVSAMMYSPNYWDEQNGIGHKHYFFMLKGCENDTNPNGFFNEYLKEDLMKHKKVFEALGSKMSVESSQNQLSGLGFSSTKRNELIVKITSNFSRVLKIKF